MCIYNALVNWLMTCLWNVLGLWTTTVRCQTKKSWRIQAMAQQNVEVGTVFLLDFFPSSIEAVCFFWARPGVICFWAWVWSCNSEFLVFNCRNVFCWSRSFLGEREKSPTKGNLLAVAGARSSTFYRGAWWGACWDPQVFNGKFHGNGWFRALVIWG